MRRLAVKALVELSVASPGKKGSKLGHQIPNAEVSRLLSPRPLLSHRP